jgi:hypothetical protein
VDIRTHSVEANRGIKPTIAHAPTGIVHGIDPPNDGFEKVPNFNRLADTTQESRPVNQTLEYFLGKSAAPPWPACGSG